MRIVGNLFQQVHLILIVINSIILINNLNNPTVSNVYAFASMHVCGAYPKNGFNDLYSLSLSRPGCDENNMFGLLHKS